MEPIHPPHLDDIRPGARFEHNGEIVAVKRGKHPNGDLRVEVERRGSQLSDDRDDDGL